MRTEDTMEQMKVHHNGSILSPVLANIYMHYVLTLWFEKKVKVNFKGECYITVYADDFVCCFQYKGEAETFMNEILPNRLGKFGLQLAEDKTRLIKFGRFAEQDSKPNKPETFDFLGFTHYCSTSRDGRFRVKRKTSRKKFKSKIKEFNIWLKENKKLKLKELMPRINAKLRGHYQYFGITDNYTSLNKFLYEIDKMLFKHLNRRSQRNSYSYETYRKMKEAYPLISPKIYVNIYDI